MVSGILDPPEAVWREADPAKASGRILSATWRPSCVSVAWSLTATATRLVQLGSFPAVVVVSDASRMRWFRRGPDVPESLWPHAPGRKTFAYDIAKGQTDRGSGHVYVDEWLAGAVERHSILEDSRRVTDDLVLSILWWTDERPLEDIAARDEGRAARRSDWRKD